MASEVDVIGPENILFAGASVHLSARKLYRLGQCSEGVQQPKRHLKMSVQMLPLPTEASYY